MSSLSLLPFPSSNHNVGRVCFLNNLGMLYICVQRKCTVLVSFTFLPSFQKFCLLPTILLTDVQYFITFVHALFYWDFLGHRLTHIFSVMISRGLASAAHSFMHRLGSASCFHGSLGVGPVTSAEVMSLGANEGTIVTPSWLRLGNVTVMVLIPSPPLPSRRYSFCPCGCVYLIQCLFISRSPSSWSIAFRPSIDRQAL